ncbi:hypothetical protein D3C85_1816760 [compost metagenome]
MSCITPFIFCAPCDTPMAKIRKGTRIEYGSRAKPRACISPSCQITATTEQPVTSRVLRTQRM